MNKEKKIQTHVRVTPEDLEFIQDHPGKTFTNKLQNMIQIYRTMIDNPDNVDKEVMAYEKLAKRYMRDYYPIACKKAEENRKQLNHYQDLLQKLEALDNFLEEFQKTVDELNQEVQAFMKKTFKN